MGLSRARSEYTATVVFALSFWLQSMKTFPLRSWVLIRDTTSSGCSDSSMSASACESVLVVSKSTGAVQRDIDLQTLGSRGLRNRLAGPSLRASRGATGRPWRTRSPRPAAPGSRSKTMTVGRSAFFASASEGCSSIAAMFPSQASVRVSLRVTGQDRLVLARRLP